MSSKPVTQMMQHSEPGYFGKVATHGDFVSRGLPKSFIDPWDSWLQEAIASSRQQLGEDWLNHYLTSPVYRFALSPGICGDSAWLGVLMPSVDRVGRYFPLTLTASADPQINPFRVLEQRDGWFSQIENLALSSLQNDFDLDAFNQQLIRLTLETQSFRDRTGQVLETGGDSTAGHAAWQRSVEDIQSLTDAILPGFMDDLMKEFCFAYSVWWTQGSEQVEPSLLVCKGLPPFESMVALFDGNWQQWGWEGRRFPLLSEQADSTVSDNE